MKKICDLKTRNELADFLKIPRQKFTQILYSIYPNNCYTTFEIPKKKGGTRSINAPNDELKEITKEVREKDAIENIIYQKASPAVAINCGPGTFGLLFAKMDDE